jgi:hypothetical protein
MIHEPLDYQLNEVQSAKLGVSLSSQTFEESFLNPEIFLVPS